MFVFVSDLLPCSKKWITKCNFKN